MPQEGITSKVKGARLAYIWIWGIVAAIITWDSVTSILNRKETLISIVCLVLFVLFSLLWFWSYWVACWSDPGSLETFYRDCGVLEMLQSGNIPDELTALPVCNKCHLPKPDRTHHCSVCNQCYFRFDHHCPVIGNCVALWNYKGFLLMPIYGGVLILLTGIELGFHRDSRLAIPSVVLLFFVWGFAFSYCPMIARNETTLEVNFGHTRPGKDRYWDNFKEIYNNILQLFLPTRPKISGFYWQDSELPENIKKMIQRMKHGHTDAEEV